MAMSLTTSSITLEAEAIDLNWGTLFCAILFTGASLSHLTLARHQSTQNATVCPALCCLSEFFRQLLSACHESHISLSGCFPSPLVTFTMEI